MNYLELLKAKTAEKRLESELSLLPKAEITPFGSFGSTEGEHISEIDCPMLVQQREARRQEILQMMADDQSKKIHHFTDTKADPDFVILAIGIRGVATFEMKVPRSKFDPFLLMQAMEREH